MKSAVRVLEILEHFAAIRRPAGVTEIAQALGYPASSTAAMLRSLERLGYLQQGERRLYRPTARVTLLGAWIVPALSPGGAIRRILEELGDRTGETILLGVLSGDFARYVEVVPATRPVRMHVAPGATRPLPTSGLGLLFLAGMPDAEAVEALRRHNARQPGETQRVSPEALRRDLRLIRARGHAMTHDRVTPGAGVVAVRLPPAAWDGPGAICIGAPSSVIKAQGADFAALIKDAIRRHLPEHAG